jgi:hypothetical protein
LASAVIVFGSSKSPQWKLRHFLNIIASFFKHSSLQKKKTGYKFAMATSNLKWPVTKTLFNNIKFIVRQGNLLWELSFSYKDEQTPFIISSRGDSKFKLFLDLLHYIHPHLLSQLHSNNVFGDEGRDEQICVPLCYNFRGPRYLCTFANNFLEQATFLLHKERNIEARKRIHL